MVVLGASGTTFFLRSDTVAIVTRPCREDDGMANLRGARDRIVIIGKGAVVPHTRVRLIRTTGTFFSANCRQDHRRRQYPQYLRSQRMPTELSHPGSGWCKPVAHK